MLKSSAYLSENPFKFGTVVSDTYFTNWQKENTSIKTLLSSPNHLTLIAPRRYGKTSLIFKVLEESQRKSIYIDFQLINSINDFASQYLKRIYKLYPIERIKGFLRHFRVLPEISLNPLNDEINISFKSSSSKEQDLLEDVLNLLDKVADKSDRPVVVLDEFQDIYRIDKSFDRKLRSIMQKHTGINYIFLGSMESMMREIFENKKAPFYHFSQLMYLQKISREDFTHYITRRIVFEGVDSESIANRILDISQCHPHYTQQLAYQVWHVLKSYPKTDDAVACALEEILKIHDLDFERLWETFNTTDKKILLALSLDYQQPYSSDFLALTEIASTSTILSAMKRLSMRSYVTHLGPLYEIEDPFFKRWIIKRRNDS